MAQDVKDFDQDVIQASFETPVVVDFWAPWCGPCRIIGPVLERLSQEQDGHWKLVKVNADLHPELSTQYRIYGIPAVKLFVNGEVADEFVGAMPENVIRRWLSDAIPATAENA